MPNPWISMAGKVEQANKRCMGNSMKIRVTRPSIVNFWTPSCTIPNLGLDIVLKN